MDILTQGLLGGVVAQSVSRYEEKTPATLAGLLAGLLADADVLIRSSTDPLLAIEYHRHFTHSIFFIPFGAAIAMLLLWPFMRRTVPLARLYLFCFAGFSLSGALDACTSYGTYLFWPLYNERIALNIISIVDPVFTLILLITLIQGLRLRVQTVSVIGLACCAGYLGFAYTQQVEARTVAGKLLALRGASPERHVIKPTLGNLVLWRSVYLHDDRIYVDAIRLGVFDENRIIEGESVQRMDLERDLPELDPDSLLYKDIQRFTRFSKGYVAFDPTQENVIGDIRYSLLPVSVKPLWGIVIDPSQPEQHADYRFFRQTDQRSRQRFIDLVLGKYGR